MQRILNSWPYVAVVIAGHAVFWLLLLGLPACPDAAGGCLLTDMELMSLIVTYLYVGLPVIAFATGAVLGFRRGYDWITVVTCLIVWLAIPEPQPAEGGGIRSLFWDSKLWFPLLAVAVIGHLGIVAGMGVRRLTRQHPA